MSTVNNDNRQERTTRTLSERLRIAQRINALIGSSFPPSAAEALSLLKELPGWWLSSLREMRTPCPRARENDLLPDVHYEPTGRWQAMLQRTSLISGTKRNAPVSGVGTTAAIALLVAITAAIKADDENEAEG